MNREGTADLVVERQKLASYTVGLVITCACDVRAVLGYPAAALTPEQYSLLNLP